MKKDITVCDKCGKRIDDNKGASVVVKFKSSKTMTFDGCPDCAGDLARQWSKLPKPTAREIKDIVSASNNSLSEGAEVSQGIFGTV